MLARVEHLWPLIWFLALLCLGASLGLTDDEAYYWVLARKPALGYAFHPPMVAWLIGLAQFCGGWLVGPHSPGLVRLPAALCSAGILGVALGWVRDLRGGRGGSEGFAFALFISFAGLFALSFMMVPDLPLFLGWTLAFVATWKICFRDARFQYAWLGAGIALAVLSKFSGVLAAASSGLAILCWAPRARRWPSWLAIAGGGLLAALPILIWNASHEWASILYQIRDRHEGGGGLSWLRYGRFWGVQCVAAGPVLVAYAGWILFRAWRERRFDRPIAAFAVVWILPALLFCVQPLWAEFKPHWAFIVWWPALLALAAECVVRGPRMAAMRRFARGHLAWGGLLLAGVVVFCEFPVGAVFFREPKLDVTNDLYGWSELPAYLKSLPGPLPGALVGSRYQTASQAAFALADEGMPVTFLPRDRKSLEEWPDLGVSDGQGPAWPRLLVPVLYVTDNRYDAGPEFPGASCRKLGRLEKRRGTALAKWIELWRCEPGSGPSGSS